MATVAEQALEYIEKRVPRPVQVAITSGRGGEWIVGVHSGYEADDSPMVGGAGYGLGPSVIEALAKALGDFGFKPQED